MEAPVEEFNIMLHCHNCTDIKVLLSSSIGCHTAFFVPLR